METMEITNLFGGVYKNKVCLITGHTGFKGSWLSYWLTQMGAEVIGFSLEPEQPLNHFDLLDKPFTSIIGDIRNYEQISKVFEKHKPDVVFHLAAQSLVRCSYNNPIDTFDTNVLGTVNVFEASRHCDSVKAVVNITSDKCYENKEWIWGYRENDSMGGHDPYSASKGCAELVTTSYQRSYFNHNSKLIASGRAGNVIGGGDWAEDRLIPDIVRAASKGSPVEIRNPLATRPWQHVLEPLSGYLTLGWKLLQGYKKYADGWNFGPDLGSNVTVENIINKVENVWDKVTYNIIEDKNNHHEANLLMLDCSKANKLLKWAPVWDLNKTIFKTMNWYKSFYEDNYIQTKNDLLSYIEDAKSKSIIWTL
ncbi:CDP-glucose 4,6-dehydratase [bacterium]|nr:CDP-glucose 4,6-dehydratase [bacterium]